MEVGSSDLKKSKLRCSVLFVDSCSSIDHFYCALRLRRKELQKERRNREKACVFYLTETVQYSIAESPYYFVKMVLEGKDPTKKKDAKLICKKLNSVNPRLYRTERIRHASGNVTFSIEKGLLRWEKKYLRRQRGSCKAAYWRGK